MLLLFVLACAGKGDDTGEVDETVRIEIVSPDEGATVPTCFDVTVVLHNFTLTDYLEHPDPVEGEGHWILDFDDRFFVCEALECGLDLSGAAAGDVTVRAVLVGNDHNVVLDDDGAEIDDTITVDHAPSACHEE